MVAGVFHTVVMTDERQAYSFGDGGYGQLGHGDEENEYVPRLMEGVVPGYERTLVCTDEGKA